ncbi:MAG: alpha/beta hydrolase, partial [Cyanobacteria bacterium P01_A01_bin.135]
MSFKSLGLPILISGLSTLLLPTGAEAAETIYAAIGPAELTLTVDSIETFVEEGKLTGKLKRLSRFLDEETLAQIRTLLGQPIEISAATAARLTYTAIGEESLTRLGTIIQTEARQNGLYAMRAAIILAANSPEGLTLLSMLQYFPTDGIRIDMDATFALVRDFFALSRDGEAALEAIAYQSEQEISAAEVSDFAQRPNLQQQGPYAVEKQLLTLRDSTRASLGNPDVRQFSADLYLPQLSQAVPLVVISHGLGAQRSGFAVLAEHIASYGFAVAVPEHVGSNTEAINQMVAGNYFGPTNASEFIDRPQDITFLLDQLERHNTAALAGRLLLDQVGIIGHSLGGYTALVLATGEINHAKLDEICADQSPTLNLSLILQCQATELPQPTADLQDPRIAAVMALNPIPSALLGQESLSQVDVPVMMVQASQDILAPMLQEQLFPFNWLTAPQKYLVTLAPAGHGSANQSEPLEENLANSLLTGPNTTLGSAYT